MNFIQEINSSIPTEFTLIVLVWLLGCSIKFKLAKRSISTMIILVSAIVSLSLSLFHLHNIAELILVATVVLLIARAIMKQDNDVWLNRRRENR